MLSFQGWITLAITGITVAGASASLELRQRLL
jgi:hypothetical protein